MLGDFGSGIALTFLSQEFDDFDISLRVSKQRGIKAMKLLPQLPIFLEESLSMFWAKLQPFCI